MSINRDFTMIPNDLFRYGARVCESLKNTYALCLLIMSQYGDKKRRIYFRDGKIARFMNCDQDEFLSILKSLHDQGLIKVAGEACMVDEEAILERIQAIKAADATIAEREILGGER